MPSAQLQIELVDDAGALAALAPEWDALFAASAVCNPFLSREWAEAWWESFGDGRRLHLLAARAGGRLAGLAPLYRERGRLAGLPFTRLRLIGSGIAAADHLDFLLDPAHAEAAASALLRGLASGSAPRVIELDGLAETSPLPALWQGRRTSPLCATRRACPYLALPETWDAYLASLSSNRRQQLRRFGRRLERAHPGQVAYRTVADEDECAGVLEELFRLHQASKQRQGLPGAFRDEPMRRFHRAVARRFLDRGWLRLHYLTVAGRVVAAIESFRAGGDVLFYTTGYDPDLAEYRPGRLIMYYAIEKATEEGAPGFDFLRGDEDYKGGFTDQARHDLVLSLSPQPWLDAALTAWCRAKPLKRRLKRLLGG